MGLGTGQILTLAMRLHTVCFKLQRNCYIKLYSSYMAQYFGYADGSSWSVEDAVAAMGPLTNASVFKQIHISRKSTAGPGFIHGTLAKSLKNETHPRLHVVLQVALQGFEIKNQISHNNLTSTRTTYGLDSPCLLRYVTQPRNLTRASSLPRAPVVVHMRTGYADADKRLLSAEGVPRNSSATELWMWAACGVTMSGLAHGPARVALSDSPGLLRWLSERYGIRSGSAGHLGNVTLTRTFRFSFPAEL